MAEIGATEFKARCLELMDRVESARESFLITKRGRPVARLVPIEKGPSDTILGCMQGQVSIRGGLVRPSLEPGAWEAIREWDDLEAR